MDKIHTVRRKEGRCEYWLGAQGRCPKILKMGDKYFDGELKDYTGNPFNTQRWCMDHYEAVKGVCIKMGGVK